MPEFDQPDESCFHSCTIHFKTEADMLHFAKLIGQPVAQTTRYIWIPRQEQLDLKNYRVVDES